MKQLYLLPIFIFSTLFSNAQVLIQDILPGSNESYPGYKYVFNNQLVFCSLGFSGWKVTVYKDTPGFKAFQVPASGLMDSRAYNSMTIANGKLYYGAAIDTFGAELCMWDGINPPSMIKDILPGRGDSRPDNFITLNNKVYFVASKELWEHDPATMITRQLSNLDPANAKTSTPRFLTVFNNKLYFSVSHTSYISPQLTMYDPVLDVVKLVPHATPSDGANVGNLTVCYNKLYYVAATPAYGRELYAYDGSSAPARLTDISPGSASSLHDGSFHPYTVPFIAGFKGSVYFESVSTGFDNEIYRKLYKFDPNKKIDANNPSMVYDIRAAYTEFIEFDNKLYFVGSDQAHGFELWAYDGVNKPAMVGDISKGTSGSNPRFFAVYKNNLYFSASDNINGSELYRLHQHNLQIENASRISDIAVYPVPATNILNFKIDLKTDCSFRITLTDITGREVYSSDMMPYQGGSVTVTTDVSKLESGNYYYNVVSNDGITIASGKVAK